MCGICGTAGFADRELLGRMAAVMAHRGPDDEGFHVSPGGRAGLGHRRLRIIDLSPAAGQPMANEDGTLRLVYNGEIYNFRELREELVRGGHRFRSQSDGEVILHLYEELGAGCLTRLNGIFALALWDERDGTLLLARDPLGVKPLYYAETGRGLVFASEVKGLLQAEDLPAALEPAALPEFLTFLWVPGPRTMFRGVRKLMPGERLHWRDGRITTETYWDLNFIEEPRPAGQLADELRAMLAAAVKRQLVADVPVGVFLSGGVDSSAILALATEAAGGPVRAYTIAYRESDARLEQSGRDRYYARRVAKRFGADYHEIEVAPDVAALLPRVVWHLDEPVADPAAISTLLICEAARPEVTVLLSGQGGDEVFAGYRWHRNEQLARLAGLAPRFMREGLFRPALALLPRVAGRLPGASSGYALAVHRYGDKFLRGLDRSPEERYVAFRAYYDRAGLAEVLAPELREQLAGADPFRSHLDYFERHPADAFLNRALYVDTKTFLPELNLTYSDKLSMAASLEVRVPLLDLEIVRFMAGVPTGLKLRGLTTKYLFKRALAGLVPDEVIRRRKAGFGAPIRQWLRADLAPLVADLLAPDRLRDRGLLDPAVVARMIRENAAGTHDHTYRLWAFLTLEMWLRNFVDRVRPTGPVN